MRGARGGAPLGAFVAAAAAAAAAVSGGAAAGGRFEVPYGNATVLFPAASKARYDFSLATFGAPLYGGGVQCVSPIPVASSSPSPGP